jgi:hypothetical protein
MAQLVFTSHLSGIAPERGSVFPGGTVAEVLTAAFQDHPRLKAYIVDDQGRLRKHVILFVDDEQLTHDMDLRRQVRADSEIYVMQALSGG